MFTKETAIKYATDFLIELIENGISIEYAKLFGSFSKSTFSEDSDIDILIVSKDFAGVSFIDFPKFSHILRKYYHLDVKTSSLNDYLDKNPFLKEIDKNSIDLLSILKLPV